MGPITLFDKSFLQSLSLDESVWFDHFFLTNVCPFFYVETLADLGKSGKRKRKSDDEVHIIAEKFPDMSSGPCALHTDLSLDSLLGYDVPMTGQIPLDTGRLVSFNGKLNVIAEESPVAIAFSRWQNGEFDFVERKFAKQWRNQLSQINLVDKPEILDSWYTFQKPCNSLQQARDLAINFIGSSEKPFLRIEICLDLLRIPKLYEDRVRARWAKLGYPSILEYAPYAAFVVSVILFFHLAVGSGLISSERVSNLIDIAYLFYLPFCMVFVSSDRLHRRVAPLFLRNNQEFVWGPDLKASLKEINLYFSLYPDDQKEQGIHTIAPTPPQHIPTLVSELWDRHLKSWRKKDSDNTGISVKVPFEDIKQKVKQMEKMPGVSVDPETFRIEDIHSATIKRKVRMRKGAWYRVPKIIGK